MMKKISSDRSIKMAVAVIAVGAAIAVAQQQQPAQAQPVHAQPAQAQQVQPQDVDPDWDAAMAERPNDASAARLTAGVQNVEAAKRYKEEIRGGVRRGTELSAAALASAPFLYLERNAQGRVRPDDTKLMPSKNRAAYQLFDRAMVRPSGGGVAFEIGDTVDVVRVDSLVSFRGNSGRIVMRVGRAEVEEKVGRRYVVRLNEMWGIVRGGEGILPMTRFEPVYCDNLVKPDVEIHGTIVRRVDNTTTPYMHQYLIIDKGEKDGVMIGDFFKVKERRPEDQLSEDVLEAQVVNVTPISATLVIQKLAKPDLRVGDHVYLNRRPVNAASLSSQASAADAAAATPPALPPTPPAVPPQHNEPQPARAQ